MPIIGKPLLVLGSLAGVSLLSAGSYFAASALDSQQPTELNKSLDISNSSEGEHDGSAASPGRDEEQSIENHQETVTVENGGTLKTQESPGIPGEGKSNPTTIVEDTGQGNPSAAPAASVPGTSELGQIGQNQESSVPSPGSVTSDGERADTVGDARTTSTVTKDSGGPTAGSSENSKGSVGSDQAGRGEQLGTQVSSSSSSSGAGGSTGGRSEDVQEQASSTHTPGSEGQIK